MPLSWLVAFVLYAVFAAVLVLLGWVTIKPWARPSPTWAEEPAVELNWVDALRPRTLKRIGVALEHAPGDAEILNRALGLAIAGQTKLMLLHVVDTPMSGVYGDEAGDRHADADAKYMNEVTATLRTKGFDADSILLHGPDRAGVLVAQLKRDPVDLLVVGSHGHGLVRDLLYGQTVDKVRHGLEIPMLIARPDR
jgi:manganese transport protein